MIPAKQSILLRYPESVGSSWVSPQDESFGTHTWIIFAFLSDGTFPADRPYSDLSADWVPAGCLLNVDLEETEFLVFSDFLLCLRAKALLLTSFYRA